jgi:RNA polymerase sigma-32 factor
MRSLDLYRQSIKHARFMTAEQERAAFESYRAGDKNAGDRIVESMLPFAAWKAGKYARRSCDFEDLVQQANLGIVRALVRFDASRGVRFMTYAGWWVEASIESWLFDMRRLVRQPAIGRDVEREVRRGAESPEDAPSFAKLDPEYAASVWEAIRGGEQAFGAYEPANDDEPLPDALDRQQMRARVRDAMGRLPQRELDVIVRHYWGEESLADIARSWNMSRERARQLEARAISRMRKRLRVIYEQHLEAA